MTGSEVKVSAKQRWSFWTFFDEQDTQSHVLVEHPDGGHGTWTLCGQPLSAKPSRGGSWGRESALGATVPQIRLAVCGTCATVRDNIDAAWISDGQVTR